MIFALGATFFFSLSAVLSARMVGHISIPQASFWRMVVACTVLSIISFTVGVGFGGGAFFWFFLSGMVGFGVGDLAGLTSIRHLGPRLGVMIIQCLAAPIAALVEWLWLDTTLTWGAVLSDVVILSGICIALSPRHVSIAEGRSLPLGVWAGILGAAGQGLGAVLSRRGFEAVAAAGTQFGAMDSTFQRVLGGLLVAALALVWMEWRSRGKNQPHEIRLAAAKRSLPWLFGHAMTGPVLGIFCYQAALRGTPSGIVLPIVAMVPLMIIPFTWWMDGERPALRSLVGGALAVGGVILLGWLH